jgi:hypothetical protein
MPQTAQQLALAATIHDPEERLLSLFEPGLAELGGLYGNKAVAYSAATSIRTVEALESYGFTPLASGIIGIGASRRLAAGTVLSSGDTSWVHYCDLDRLLHWHHAYPEELRQVLMVTPENDFVALGRTERAFMSHPRVQVLAETLTNEAFSALVDSGRSYDMVAGSCLFSRRAGEIILQQSIEPTNATDLEWPGLIWRELGVIPDFRAVEGLEFETADCYQSEIMALGSREAWITATYDRPESWVARTTLALDSIAALGRVIGRNQAE